MSNYDIIIEINDYESRNYKFISFNDLICIFILDNYEGSINIGQCKFQKIKHRVYNVKSNLKYMLKIFNLKIMCIIGISELIIPYSNIINKDINKKCIIKIEESNNCTLENLKEIIISFKIKIEVLKTSNKNNIKGYLKKKNRIRSNPLGIKYNYIMELKKSLNYTPIKNKSKQIINTKNSKLKTFSNIPLSSYRLYRKRMDKNKNTIISNYKFDLNNNKIDNSIKSRIKSKSITNGNNIVINSASRNSNNKSHKKNINSVNDIKTFYDESSKNNSMFDYYLYDNNFETEDNSEKINKEIFHSLNYFKLNNNKKKCIKKSTENYYVKKKKIKERIENLINYHFILVLKLKDLFKENKQLKKFLILNSERLQYLIKQNYKINQLKLNSISSKIKVNINSLYNTNIYRRQSHIHKKEFKVIQNIFNLIYFEYDVFKYKESLLSKKIDDQLKLKLLLKCIKHCIFSFGNIIEIFDEINLKNQLKNIFLKYNIKDFPISKNNYILKPINKKNDSIKIIKEVDEEKENDSEDSFYEKQVDKKIKEIENRKLTSVKFIKISPNFFQFGTKKIKVKLFNSELKVKLDNNNYINLEDYIDKIKKNEENLLKIKKNFFPSSLKLKDY